MPFYVLFFLSIGFSFLQIAIIATIRSIVSLVFEVPTGAIADIYGRKTSVIIGYLLMGVSTIAVVFTTNFYLLVIIFALNAIFETLVSGADSAWAFDLADKYDNKLTDKYFLKKRVFRNIGMVIAPLLAGLIVSFYGMTNLWFVYGVGILLSAIFLFFAEKVDANKSDNDKPGLQPYKKVFVHATETWNFIKNHRILSLLFFSVFIFFFVEEISSLAWTPYLQANQVSLPQIGYLFSIIAGFGIITPLIAEKVLRYRSKFAVLIVTTIIYSFAMIFAALFSKVVLIVILFVLAYNLEEVIEPIEEAITNSFIESKIRATALSLKSVVSSAASIVGGPIAGYLLGAISLKNALLLSGLLFLFIPSTYLVARKRFKQVL
jgi:MFS family permease